MAHFFFKEWNFCVFCACDMSNEFFIEFSTIFLFEPTEIRYHVFFSLRSRIYVWFNVKSTSFTDTRNSNQFCNGWWSVGYWACCMNCCWRVIFICIIYTSSMPLSWMSFFESIWVPLTSDNIRLKRLVSVFPLVSLPFYVPNCDELYETLI